MDEGLTGRCGSCQHWRSLAGDWDFPKVTDDFGFTVYDDDGDSIPMPGEWGNCRKAALFGPGASDRFYVIDGSQYRADLNTRDDFGCVEHEPTETP